MEYKEDSQFDVIYNDLYNKYFEKFERKRQKEKSGCLVGIVGAGLVFFAFVLIDIYIEEKSNIALLLVSILFGIIGIAILYPEIKRKSNYKELYKEEVIRDFVQKILPNFEYLPYENIESIDNMVELYRKAQFDIRKFNRSISDDYIYGNYKDMKLSMCELNTYYEYVDNKNEKRYENRFSGIFANIKVSCYKDIDIKILNRNMSIEESRNMVKVDNDEFNKNFVVISNSNIKAFEILTLDIIQILNDIAKNNNIKFDISIMNNNIYFRFYTSPIFEPSINEPVMKKESFYRYYILLKFILTFSNTINKIYKDLTI